MDNQQALTQLELGWLCGFFDGEGYVGINVTKNASTVNKKHIRRDTIMIPRLVASNTDYPTIDRYRQLFNKADVGVHLQAGRKGSEKHKTIYRAVINGYKRCYKAIPIFLNGCITKKGQLEIMYEWLNYRQSNWHYSIQDYEFYKQFKQVAGMGLNDSTLKRLYDSCTAEQYKPREYPLMAWESRRKVEPGRIGNIAD